MEYQRVNKMEKMKKIFLTSASPLPVVALEEIDMGWLVALLIMVLILFGIAVRRRM